MRREVRLYRICWAMFCPSVNGLYCSLRPASRASDLAHCQPLVHYKVFALLIGGLWKSPNWISLQLASQDETGGGGGRPAGRLGCLLFFAKRAARDRKREGTGVQREWKCDLCSSFSVFARHALQLPAHTKRRAFEARLVISRHFFLLCETLECCILKLYFTLAAICSFFFIRGG